MFNVDWGHENEKQICRAKTSCLSLAFSFHELHLGICIVSCIGPSYGV
jgi:hypothetical protein